MKSMTIRIYDISIDAMRDATQRDVDKLVRIANAYGMLDSVLRDQRSRVGAARAGAARTARGPDAEAVVIDMDAGIPLGAA